MKVWTITVALATMGCAAEVGGPTEGAEAALNSGTHVRSTCTADEISSHIDGSDVGCITNVNGHENVSNAAAITKLGCRTFCSAVATSAIR